MLNAVVELVKPSGVTETYNFCNLAQYFDLINLQQRCLLVQNTMIYPKLNNQHDG